MADIRPLLLEESTRQALPSSLTCLIENLYKSTDKHKEVTKLELIGSLVYILMLETGFTPVMTTDMKMDSSEKFSGDISFNINRMNIFCHFARNWNVIGSNNIEMHFFLKPCQETFDVIVSMTTFGTGIALNLIIMNNATRELEHLFPYFISSVKYILNQSAPINKKFNNLKELSIDFKNRVALPAKYTILNTDYLMRNASLQYLPYELHLKIAQYLDLRSFGRYIRTCKHLNQCCAEQKLWKYFCAQLDHKQYQINLRYEAIEGLVVDWRNVCKEIKRSFVPSEDDWSYVY